MTKKKKLKQRTGFVTLLLILSFAGIGCGDGQQAKNPVQTQQKEGTKTASKAGSLNYRYFYEKDGIVLSSPERFLYSDWDPVEFDYICMDPTCSHLNERCSARTIQDESSRLRDFSLLYQDRLIILHAYFQVTVNELSETTKEWIYVMQTDVYEADSDGSNRRKMAAFSGSIDSPDDTHAAVLVDGKLYFGGPTEVRDVIRQDNIGGEMTFESWTNDAIYCLNLNDYTLEIFADSKNREGTGYQYQLYEYDGMIYGIMSNFLHDNAVWYRIDPAMDDCEEILRFDSNVARFWGAIGDTVYYTYEGSWNTLHARDTLAEAAEREIMTVTGEDMIANPFVLDGQLLIMTERCVEGEDRMAEYAVFDQEGNVLDTIRYDDYILLLDVVGDKIIYFRGYPDWEVWWADKEDIRDLSDKGVRIGPLNGATLDKLAN